MHVGLGRTTAIRQKHASPRHSRALRSKNSNCGAITRKVLLTHAKRTHKAQLHAKISVHALVTLPHRNDVDPCNTHTNPWQQHTVQLLQDVLVTNVRSFKYLGTWI
jgi:hypothetical protein